MNTNLSRLAGSVANVFVAGGQSPRDNFSSRPRALDAANSVAYVAMLRRAAEIVGASQVLFVTHSVELQELADSRIVVDGGKVRVAA